MDREVRGQEGAGPVRATIFFSNELSIEADGWAMIAPLGDYPSEALLPTADGKLKRQRAIQRITKESAEEMVAQFHSSRAGLKKFIRGCNIYVGHPDMPGMEGCYPDREPKGVFADMRVSDSGDNTRKPGIYGLPVFTNEGMDLVEGRKLVNGKRVRGFSGRLIEATPDGTQDGLPVFIPTRIASAGLTPFPHLPVEFFNEENILFEQPRNKATKSGKVPLPIQNQTMKKKLLQICTVLGIQFANDADDAQLEAALDQMEEKITTLQTSLIAERDQARAEFANERAGRITDELAFAVTSGRITEAEKPIWESRLKVEAQFVNERNALHALQPKVKTTSVTITRGQRKDQIDLANPRQRQQFVNEVLTEIAAEQKLDPVRQSKQILNLARERHPALFDLPHVEIRK